MEERHRAATSGDSLRPTISKCLACMPPKLVGWGSNLHGQLGQDLSVLQVAAPVTIDNAERIVCVTATQVLYTLNGQMYLYGYMPDHDSKPTRHSVPWTNPRAILGQDYVEACLDEDGYLCLGFSNTRCGQTTWQHAAMDKTGRIIAISNERKAVLFNTLNEMVLGINAIPLSAPNLPPLDRAFAGGSHFVLFAPQASLPIYTYGDNRFCQLGDIYVPSDGLHALSFFSREEGFPSSIHSVVCGDRHSLALTSDGDCYFWGWSVFHGHTLPEPVDVGHGPDLVNVLSMACATDASIFLLEDGSVWSTKRGDTETRFATEAHRVQFHGMNYPLDIGAAQWSYYALVQNKESA